MDFISVVVSLLLSVVFFCFLWIFLQSFTAPDRDLFDVCVVRPRDLSCLDEILRDARRGVRIFFLTDLLQEKDLRLAHHLAGRENTVRLLHAEELEEAFRELFCLQNPPASTILEENTEGDQNHGGDLQ